MNKKKTYLAGGCFWEIEELIRMQPGIVDTEVGYIGGDNENPTYQNHPGHAEAIEVTYDSEKTSFEMILDYFYRIHNPTTINKQGNDRGSAYRSAIFYQNEDEKAKAEAFILKVNESGRWESSVVTTLDRLLRFTLQKIIIKTIYKRILVGILVI